MLPLNRDSLLASGHGWLAEDTHAFDKSLGEIFRVGVENTETGCARMRSCYADDIDKNLVRWIFPQVITNDLPAR